MYEIACMAVKGMLAVMYLILLQSGLSRIDSDHGLVHQQGVGELLEGDDFAVLQRPDVRHARAHAFLRGAVLALVGADADDVGAGVEQRFAVVSPLVDAA